MNRFLTTRRKIVAGGLAAAVVLGGGYAAYAYWTSAGAGSGSATTGTSGGVTINQTSVVTAMGPGVAAQALSGTFTTAKPAHVAQVTAAVTTTSNVGCHAADFTIVQPAPTNAEVVTGGTWGGGSIAFNDSATVNQDACQGVTVTIGYTST
jgi:hypothetical protein